MGSGYKIMLDDGQLVYFNEMGEYIGEDGMGGGMHGNGGGMGGGMHDGGCNNCMGGDTIPAADLPQAVLDYVTENYPGDSIENAMLENNGYLFLHLSSGVMLLFDADGNTLFDSGN